MSEQNILATIDGVNITDADLDAYIANLPKEQQAYAAYPQFREHALKQLLAFHLYAKMAEEEKMDETKDSFVAISNAVDEGKAKIVDVNEKSRAVEGNNQGIVSVIQNLSAIAEENAATTQQASASVETQVQSISDISKASESLAEIATNLQNEVSKFQL